MQERQSPAGARHMPENSNKYSKFFGEMQGPHMDIISAELAEFQALHDKAKTEEKAGKSYQKVLAELLSLIQPLDFRERAVLEADDKITRKLYVVIAIDQIIETAITNDWGLCTKDGFTYVFNGKYWQTATADEFMPFLAEAAMKMGVPELEAKYHQFKDELYKQFMSASNLPTPEPGKAVLINLLNGTFEISQDEQTLRTPRRENFLKYQLSFEYDPAAECPIFRKYLNRVMPDEYCQKVLAEYLGYIFVNDLKLEKALILYGTGANGKSVFFEIVNAMLGRDNVCSYSLQNITKYDNYQRAELSNKLLNYASEINGKLETSTFKQLVSGEPVEARQIYGKPFTMYNYAKLMFNCNELPKEVEQTDAFFRRFLIVPFNQTIPEDEQDPELAKKIIASELSGVFNWLLDGLRRVLSQKKFTSSQMVCEQIEAYRRESDSVAMFIDEEGYSEAIESYVYLKALYADYRAFCSDNGYRSCSSKTFSERLKTLGFDYKKTNQGIVFYVKK